MITKIRQQIEDMLDSERATQAKEALEVTADYNGVVAAYTSFTDAFGGGSSTSSYTSLKV